MSAKTIGVKKCWPADFPTAVFGQAAAISFCCTRSFCASFWTRTVSRSFLSFWTRTSSFCSSFWHAVSGHAPFGTHGHAPVSGHDAPAGTNFWTNFWTRTVSAVSGHAPVGAIQGCRPAGQQKLTACQGNTGLRAVPCLKASIIFTSSPTRRWRAAWLPQAQWGVSKRLGISVASSG